MNENSSTKVRSSNIELLRILTMIGVIILHYNNTGIGGGFTHVPSGSANFFALYFLESLFVCAVDLFILISGYFLCTSNSRNIVKPLQLIIQVIAFKLGVYICSCIISHKYPNSGSLLYAFIPNNYFVILYVVLYAVSVYLNIILGRLTKKQFKRMLILFILLFSVWNTLVDLCDEVIGNELIGISTVGMYGSQYGYTIVNFVLMYLVGAYIRLHVPTNCKFSSFQMILGLMLCAIAMMFWSMLNDRIGFFIEKSAWEYCNPFVIAEAALVFLLFRKITIGENKVINSLAKGAFAVFLLQNHFLTQIHVEEFVQKNLFIMLLHIVVSCIVIYFICYAVNVVYQIVMKPVNTLLSKKLGKYQIKVDLE